MGRVTSYPMVVGLLLGTLQTGLFFQLTFTLSSSFGTFLLVTLCWLLGSALGVYIISRLRIVTAIFLMLALMAYAACVILLLLFPFESRLWIVYGTLIVVTGIYAGVFFARMSNLYRVSTLFLWENNGFIAGIVLTTLLFMIVGRMALWILPLMAAVLVMIVRDLDQGH